MCNLDESDQSGSHWVAIHYMAEGQVEYFDSYGLCLLLRDLNDFVSSLDNSYTFNNIQLQSFSTTVCGSYCILFCLLRSRGMSFLDDVNLFLTVSDAHERDHVVGSFTNKNV